MRVVVVMVGRLLVVCVVLYLVVCGLFLVDSAGAAGRGWVGGLPTFWSLWGRLYNRGELLSGGELRVRSLVCTSVGLGAPVCVGRFVGVRSGRVVCLSLVFDDGGSVSSSRRVACGRGGW